MKNWQGIPNTRLTFSGKVMTPLDNSTLASSTELFNYLLLPHKGKAGTIKYLTVDLVVSCFQR